MGATDKGLTPARKLIVIPQGGLGEPINITQLLGTTVVRFEEAVNGLDKLTCTIVHSADKFAGGQLQIGDVVKFEGGYRDEDAGGGTPTRPFFFGYIAALGPNLNENGRITLTIEAFDVRYRLTRNKPGPLAYPAPKYDGELYPRTFRVGKKELKLSEIVKGILEEHKIPLGEFAIKPEFDKVFTYLDCVVQNADETDFQFLLRLLTGEGQSRFTGVHKDERRAVNGNAIWFMEVDPVSGEAKVHVADEGTILGQTGGLIFHWQGAGFPKVPEKDYDPTKPDAKIICKNIPIRHNLDLARNRVVRYRKDVQSGAVGPTGRQPSDWAGKDLVRGEEVGHIDKATSDALKFLQSGSSGQQLDADTSLDSLAGAPKVPESSATQPRVDQYAQWFKPREVRFEAASRQIADTPGAANLPTKPDTAPPTPSSLPPDAPLTRQPEADPKSTKPIGEKIQKFGLTASIHCPGNIFCQTRRTYELSCPLPNYAATDWFAYKVVMEWGLRFNMTVELGK